MDVKDSNGTLLVEGDSVQIIKDLKVKGSSSVIKRGKIVKNIRLTSSNEEVEGRVDKVQMVLKACFLKKI
ncbi:alkylphosphonate utilization protein [Flavobacterium sp. '19STA2R22 D10 B1']|uniref:alkylphosphonate utilization protein n=1 Tax=Flavobacterium aerium TaxID=3037261 RepID=UPI00278BD0CA|nr:alkylphosphonate utilization protein [Flavobacterium sp. '19STA2R22 D10 B1']